MVALRSIFALLASASSQELFLARQTEQATGGKTCIACSLVLTLAVENSDARDKVEAVLDKVCDSNKICQAAVALLMKQLDAKVSPDDLCADLSLCSSECRLFPKGEWPPQIPDAPPADAANKGLASSRLPSAVAQELRRILTELTSGASSGLLPEPSSSVLNLLLRVSGQSSFAELLEASATTAAQETLASHPCGTNVTCIVKRFTDEHLPIFDSDADAFGPASQRGFRGSHWHGADCDDRSADVYPGRKASSQDASVDHDCNGITGSNATGSYEELLCSGTVRRGLIHLGDSATAHFHLPPQWLTINSSGWNVDNLLPDAEDELDQPACAWGTGYRSADGCPYAARRGMAALPSIAARLRQRNLCNHRDFQNIGVNGARSTNSELQLASGVARDPTVDHPALVIFSFIGNDVCNGHPGTSHMTHPDEFKADVLKRLTALDSKLPAGSHVLMIGLVDGRILYDNMHAVQHPIGAKTADVYEFLNCNDASPCLGWLNSNETLRNITTEWAQSLNAQYEAILEEAHFKHFQLNYFNPDWKGIVAEWVAQGGKAQEVIEPSDGFHPSQLGNELLSEKVWEFLETKFPEAIGDINPHNNEIESLFGDQGGF